MLFTFYKKQIHILCVVKNLKELFWKHTKNIYNLSSSGALI